MAGLGEGIGKPRMGNEMRRWIFEILQPDTGTSRVSHWTDIILTVLIVVSVVIVFSLTFDLSEGLVRVLQLMEDGISVVFSIEYLLRLLTADLLYPKRRVWSAVLKYARSPLAIVDLVSILPFWLPLILPGSILGLRALRLVRLFRILKLNRYFNAVRTIGNVLLSKKSELLGSLFFVVLLMLIASLLMYSAEHDAQPTVFRNAFSGLWWAVATLTTVGYGDIYPITFMGRILGGVIALTGIAALAIPSGIITAGLTESLSKGRNAIIGELVRQRGKDCEHDKELQIQREKDMEHDRILAEQSELLRRIAGAVLKDQSDGNGLPSSTGVERNH